MKIVQKDGFKIQPILNELSEQRKILPDGSMQLDGFMILEEFEAYFLTALRFEGKSDAFARKVIQGAMRAEQKMTKDQFIGHCRRISQLLDKDQRSYKVLFPIWGGFRALAGRRRWEDISISFDIQKNSKFARKALSGRAQQLERYKQKTSIDCRQFESLPFALCSVRAVSVFDAFEQASNAIAKELGLYSLFSSRSQFMISNVPDKPINQIMIAPHMTVHDTSGAICGDVFWYNNWSTSMFAKSLSNVEEDRVIKKVVDVRNRIKGLPWRNEAENALVGYYLAFSQFDLESSFLDGWRVLEKIGGHRMEKSEVLVKRAAWFFEDTDFQYQIGRHLLERRNLISHGRPIRGERGESLAFQMKNFLSPILHGFLTNPFDFRSLEEFWGFCDLSLDRKIRSRNSYILDCASKFRREE